MWASSYWSAGYWTRAYWGAAPGAAGPAAATLAVAAVVTLDLAARFLPVAGSGQFTGGGVWVFPNRWRTAFDLAVVVTVGLPGTATRAAPRPVRYRAPLVVELAPTLRVSAHHLDYVRDVLIPEDDDLLLLLTGREG
jgi:hypothetical protein